MRNVEFEFVIDENHKQCLLHECSVACLLTAIYDCIRTVIVFLIRVYVWTDDFIFSMNVLLSKIRRSVL